MAVAVVAAVLLVMLIVGLVAVRRGRRMPAVAAAAADRPACDHPTDARSTGALEMSGAVEAVAASPVEPAQEALPAAIAVEAAATGSRPEMQWCRQFDPRSTGLDDTARLRLIGDLGVVADDWCVPLLCNAYREEQRPANREAALIALTACRSQDAVPTYRLALKSEHLAERAIATDALTDLEPARATRTIVERL